MTDSTKTAAGQTPPMRIAVLDMTEHPEPLLTGSPRVATTIADWLSPAFPEADMLGCDIAEGGAPMPAIDSFDGLLISGSEYGVYDQPEWMAPLRQLLQDTRAAGKPIFGICFGHQIMADTFGGKAEKAASGRRVGAHEFTAKGQRFHAHVWHQDQVTVIPPGATVTVRADYCPIAGLDYDFPARSVQYHPEYPATLLLNLFARVHNVFLDTATIEAATNEIEMAGVPIDLDAAATAAFFRTHFTPA